MIQVGEYNTLKVKKDLDFGLILDDGKEGILLPKRFVPRGARIGDDLKVFLYHDGEDRLVGIGAGQVEHFDERQFLGL